MPQIHLQTWVRASVAQTFTASLSIEAHLASMSSSGERVIGGVRTGVMTLGDTVTWRARHFGLPFTMTSQITAYQAPHHFVDEQVRGPFASWRHEHEFSAQGSGTLMIDRVSYASPAGVLGRVVDRLVLANYLTGLLRQRNDWLAQIS